MGELPGGAGSCAHRDLGVLDSTNSLPVASGSTHLMDSHITAPDRQFNDSNIVKKKKKKKKLPIYLITFFGHFAPVLLIHCPTFSSHAQSSALTAAKCGIPYLT